MGIQSKRKAGDPLAQLNSRTHVSTWFDRDATVNSKVVLPAVNSGPPACNRTLHNLSE